MLNWLRCKLSLQYEMNKQDELRKSRFKLKNAKQRKRERGEIEWETLRHNGIAGVEALANEAKLSDKELLISERVVNNLIRGGQMGGSLTLVPWEAQHAEIIQPVANQTPQITGMCPVHATQHLYTTTTYPQQMYIIQIVRYAYDEQQHAMHLQQ